MKKLIFMLASSLAITTLLTSCIGDGKSPNPNKLTGIQRFQLLAKADFTRFGAFYNIGRDSKILPIDQNNLDGISNFQILNDNINPDQDDLTLTTYTRDGIEVKNTLVEEWVGVQAMKQDEIKTFGAITPTDAFQIVLKECKDNKWFESPIQLRTYAVSVPVIQYPEPQFVFDIRPRGGSEKCFQSIYGINSKKTTCAASMVYCPEFLEEASRAVP